MNTHSVSPAAFTAHLYSGPQQAAVAPAVARTDIVFVEDNLPDWETLARGVPEGTQVVVLDSRGNGRSKWPTGWPRSQWVAWMLCTCSVTVRRGRFNWAAWC